MKNYYFTFGQNHWHRDGIPMKDFWVRVQAEDYITARIIFINKFSSIYMEREDKWAFQYEEEDFEPEYFGLGEFQLITQS